MKRITHRRINGTYVMKCGEHSGNLKASQIYNFWDEKINCEECLKAWPKELKKKGKQDGK